MCDDIYFLFISDQLVLDDSGTATVVPSSVFIKVIQLEDGTLALLHTEPQGKTKCLLLLYE